MAGHNKILGGGGFHHVAIRVKDFAASVKFYTEVLGFTEKISWGEDQSRAIMLDTGDGNYFELFAGGSAEPKPEGTYLHIALRCDDPDAALERCRKAGCEVTMEPTALDIPSTPIPTPVRICFCKGPDGEIIEFFKNELT